MDGFNPQTGTFWVRVYTPDGYQAALTLPITTVADALRHMNDVRAAGLTASVPVVGGLDADEKSDTITTVVRRQRENKFGVLVSVMDCYWDGAKHAFTTIYLDEPEQVAEFEAQSGVRVDAMRIYGGDTAKQLDPAKPSQFEYKCVPFVAVKAENGMKSVGGKDQMTYRFARYGSLPSATPAEATPPASVPKEDGNPFNKPAVQAAIKAAIVAHQLDQNGGVAFTLAELGTDAFGKLHPQMTPDAVLAQIPAIAAKYHLSKQLAADQKAESEAAERRQAPLAHEWVELHGVTFDPTKMYNRWSGRATHDGAPVRVLIWGEMLVKFRAAGVNTDDWPSRAGDKRVHPVNATVRLEWQDGHGYRVVEVEPVTAQAG